MSSPDHPVDARGVVIGASAYALWGLFPAFWPLLKPAGAVEILAHRVLWTAVLMAAVLTVLRLWGPLRTLTARGWLTVAAAAAAITTNWGLFIYGVMIDHVVEIALGYFMSPLVSVSLGVLVLHERLRVAQWVAVGLAAAAVLVLAGFNGRLPWLALVLAVSFGVYGLLKKQVPVEATPGLAAEGFVVGPLALAYLIWLAATGHGGFGHDLGHSALLISGGPVTAIPLLLFGLAARRIPLATLGTLMYLTPTLQFLWGWLVNHEPVAPALWVGFALVWTALLIFTADLLHTTRRRRAVEPAIGG
ncbi:MAG TPA: EamA family transporter RarD [Pseudonocardia sp.]|nr:EamA family transporter RarD [Pseudonocardia sp.]